MDPRNLPHRSILTLMFTDILGGTFLRPRSGDDAWRELSSAHDALITQEVARYAGNVVDTAGDQFFATFEWPVGAISCACAIQAGLQELDVPVRIGLHTGEDRRDGRQGRWDRRPYRRASRGVGRRGEILVSSTVKDLVEGSGLAFEERGQHDLKGLPGVRAVFALETRLPPRHDHEYR